MLEVVDSVTQVNRVQSKYSIAHTPDPDDSCLQLSK